MNKSKHENTLMFAALKILKDWASTKENWKYHFYWIEQLNTSSPEKLFQSYKDNAPSQCLDDTMYKLTFLLN